MVINNNIKIKENSLIAKFAAWKLKTHQVAIVIGNTIHLHNTSKETFLIDKRWLQHELCHIKQYNKYGIITFSILYLIESIRHGYHNNKYEQEARAAEHIE